MPFKMERNNLPPEPPPESSENKPTSASEPLYPRLSEAEKDELCREFLELEKCGAVQTPENPGIAKLQPASTKVS